MMRIVLLIVVYILQTGVSIAQTPNRPVEIDRSACMVLDDTAKPAERYIEVVLPNGKNTGARALRPAAKANLNVRIPHALAAADEIMSQMRAAMKERTDLDEEERLKLALALGCSDKGMPYVSYRIHMSGPVVRLPIAKDTPFPLQVSLCVRTEAGPFCLYGVVKSKTETRVELAQRR